MLTEVITASQFNVQNKSLFLIINKGLKLMKKDHRTIELLRLN